MIGILDSLEPALGLLTALIALLGAILGLKSFNKYRTKKSSFKNVNQTAKGKNNKQIIGNDNDVR